MVWSNPTLESLVMASSSLPCGAMSKIGCFTSAMRAPTHGANEPSNPIKIDLGTNPFTKSDW